MIYQLPGEIMDYIIILFSDRFYEYISIYNRNYNPYCNAKQTKLQLFRKAWCLLHID